MGDLFTFNAQLIPWAILIGAGVGFLSGLFGVGGGFLLTPLVNTFLGVPYTMTVGSDITQILGTSGVALLRHRKHGNRPAVGIGMTVLIGMWLGQLSGNAIMSRVSSAAPVTILGAELPVAEGLLPATFGALLLCLAVFMYFETRRTMKRAGKPGVRRGLLARVPLPPRLPGGASAPCAFLLGLPIGLLSALFGIAGGVVLLPVLVYLMGLATRSAVPTSLFIVFLASLVNTAQKAWMGHVNLTLVMSLLVSSTFGAQIGAGLSARLTGARLRRYFVIVILAGVGVVAYKIYSVIQGRVPEEAPAVELTTSGRLLRVALCLAIPLLWAPLSYWLFGRLRRDRDQGSEADGGTPPPSAPGAE